MNEQNTWTFDDGLIRFICADPGRIMIQRDDGQMAFIRRGEAHWLGFWMMSLGLREQVGALLAAYRIAWPDPVPPPDALTDALTVRMNLTIDEVKP
jgi:hypothetical protein